MLKRMIMLTKTLQIAAICFSMANTSNFYIDKPKKANEETYTQNIKLEQKSNTSGTISAPDKYHTDKYQKTSQSDAFLINATFYANTYYDETDNTTAVYTYLSQYSNSMLLVLQITPYQNTRNNLLNINIRIKLGTFTDNYLDSYTLITKQYSSTESYWNKYVDISSITNPKLNYDAIQDITDSTKGFTYAERTYTRTITETSTPTYVAYTIETQINVDPSKTNYVYYYSYNTYQSDNDATANLSLIDSNHRVFAPASTGTNDIVITGTIINPIGNYEVIDIPGIMWEVLTMPFTFISIAFNLTLFPNTPYQVNLSNLFLSILGLLIFAFILSKFIKKV